MNQLLIAAAAAAFAILLWASLPALAAHSGPSSAEPTAEFAQCVSESGAVMFGTDWCSHCTEQKELFGEYFELVEYVNCDYNRLLCDEAGVRGYPTWIINGESYPGTKPLETLAGLTGCEI